MGTKNKIISLLAIATLILGTACSKDKRDNNDEYGYLGSGYGLGGYGGMNSAVNNVSAGVDTNGQFLILLGTGTNYIEGELRLYAPVACLNMGIGLNAGVYQLQSYGAGGGMVSTNGMQNVTLRAVGPGGEALITIPYAYTFNTNVCGFPGMQGSLMIQQVAGGVCGRQLFFSDRMVNGSMCR